MKPGASGYFGRGRKIFVLLPLLLAACASEMPSKLPMADYMVVVKSARMPPGQSHISKFNDYTWIDVKNGATSEWVRLESMFGGQSVLIYPITSEIARANSRWGNPVSVVGFTQDNAAEKMIPGILTEARDYNNARYAEWPGPNANTFVMHIARDTPGLSVNFPHNAMGKDYTPFLYVGPSASGTGLQADTLLLGLELGITDGIQLHFLQSTAGISLFPPAIDLPLLPRIGFPQRGD
jgi:hypothetical protein